MGDWVSLFLGSWRREVWCFIVICTRIRGNSTSSSTAVKTADTAKSISKNKSFHWCCTRTRRRNSHSKTVRPKNLVIFSLHPYSDTFPYSQADSISRGKRRQQEGLCSGTWGSPAVTHWKLPTEAPTWAPEHSPISTRMTMRALEGDARIYGVLGASQLQLFMSKESGDSYAINTSCWFEWSWN